MWAKIKQFFKSSETIFLARSQVFVGAVLVAAMNVDPTLFAGLFGDWFPVFLIVHGVVAEFLRKRRDPERFK